MNLELFIARRLYGTRKGVRRISRPAVTIAQWGVAVGTLVMFVSICIIVGFKQQVREKVIGFGGHIQVLSGEQDSNGPLPVILDGGLIDEICNIEGIESVSPYIEKPGMIIANNEYEGILLKGIGSNYDLTFISENIIEGELPQFSDTVATNQIIISRNIAARTNSKVGDKITLYFMQGGIKARRMTVAAIYETHLTELDNIMAVTDIYTMQKLHGWQSNEVTGIEITADSYSNVAHARDAVNDIVQKRNKANSTLLYAPTVDELYPSLFSWLEILDQTVWLILILVLCIAAFTMVSGLLILILEKSNLIGILKAIGARNVSVRKIFIYYATFIIARGMVIGNTIGIIVCVLQQQTGIISIDPEMYYMDRVPIEFSWLLIPVNIAMFILSTAIMVIPSMLITKIEPSKAIKFE